MSGKDSLFDLQNQIRNNSFGIQEYLHDLSSWQDDIVEKEKRVVGGTTSASKSAKPAKPLPPVRNAAFKEQEAREKAHRERMGFSTKNNEGDIF